MNMTKKLRNVLGFLLVFGPALFLIFISTRGCTHQFKTLDDYGALKNYSFTDSKGRNRTAEEFKGEIIIITTLQKGCPWDCSVSFWRLNQILYQHIRKNSHKQLKRVRMISFVTDGKGNPEKDLTLVQQMMERDVEGYDPNLWIVASGDVRSIYNIEHNNQTLLQKGEKYYGGEGFQELILLGDKENHLRMVLKGNQEGLIRRMKESLALLLKQYDKDRAIRK
jgi:cytochrome oxidase Cu insertion factor (SCO1/SenC/PrrC family)